MKRSTKISTAIITFFLIITIVIVGRTMIGNHFKEKFSKKDCEKSSVGVPNGSSRKVKPGDVK